MHTLRGMALWPGLPSLWIRGELYSLAIASLFGVVLNLALLATFYWTEWLSVALLRSMWCAIAIASVWSLIKTVILAVQIYPARPTQECDDLLRLAHVDYLRGQYLEAEASLHKILAAGHEDVESALLLASVFRRTGRFRQALACLEKLERLDQSRKWYIEISKEKSLNLKQIDPKDLTSVT
ncbi:MAG: tetratricopeptide repeat protein [Planctomycetota bacterium]|nr:tetratricopeptide repeat protein [Planctomycetota bacterium]